MLFVCLARKLFKHFFSVFMRLPDRHATELWRRLVFLVSNGLLKEHQTRDRKAVGEACLAAMHAWKFTSIE